MDKKKDNIEKAHVQAGNAWQALRMMGELVDGYDTMGDLNGKSVTIFGSARTKPEDKYYKDTVKIAKICAKKDYNVITGGGPGLMEAGNKGAYKVNPNTKSIGIGIELPFEAGNNDYVNLDFNLTLRYFYIRKIMLMNFSDIYIGCPGGFGTLEEVFEVITLMQTNKLPKRKVILYGKKFWKPLMKWVKTLVDEGTISEKDLEMIELIDSPKEIKKYL
jgi:uncharacterized protein (TIGR00730 family)